MLYLLSFSTYMKGLTIKSTAWKPGHPPVPEELFQTIQLAQWLGLPGWLSYWRLPTIFHFFLRQSCVVFLNLELLLYHLLRLMIWPWLTPPTKDEFNTRTNQNCTETSPLRRKHRLWKIGCTWVEKLKLCRALSVVRLLETGQPSSPPDCKSFRDSRLQLSWSH